MNKHVKHVFRFYINVEMFSTMWQKQKKHQQNMKNHWFPMKIVFFVDVTMAKTYGLIWKR